MIYIYTVYNGLNEMINEFIPFGEKVDNGLLQVIQM